MYNIQSFIDEIIQLIAKDRMEEALNKAEKILNGSPMFLDFILQKSRYNSLINDMMRGTITFENSSVEANKIKYALLDLLIQIGEGTDKHPELETEVDSFLKELKNNTTTINGNGNITVQDLSNSNVNINSGKKEDSN